MTQEKDQDQSRADEQTVMQGQRATASTPEAIRALIEKHALRAILPVQHQATNYTLEPQERNALVNMRHILTQFYEALSMRAETPASVWQPISTAPKDGRLLLLAPSRVEIGQWIAKVDKALNRTGEGYWRYDRSQSKTYDMLHPPTHWQPLPEAPK